MSRQDFDSIVDDLERRFATNPTSIKWPTMLVVALGYIGFVAWVLSIAAVGIAGFILALYVPNTVAPWLIVASAIAWAFAAWQAFAVLWSPKVEVIGYRIRPADFPALENMIGRLRQRLRVPRIHRVILDCDVNAGIQQHPRLGILGWTRNTLHLGLPLLEILTPAEFEAVMAHECAHLSARHGKLFAWVYRVRGTWEALFQRLQQPPGNGISRSLRRGLHWFLEWYWPRFHAYLFVTSRFHERVADRCAAETAGPYTAATALWTIELCQRRIGQKFWPEVTRVANTHTQPPNDIMRRLVQFISSPPSEADARRWINEALNAVTDTSDTHPALSERLESLGVTSHSLRARPFPTPPRESAAVALFGESLVAVQEAVNDHWCKLIADVWRARHAQASAMRRRMDELAKVNGHTANDPNTLWDKANTMITLEGPEAAAPLLCKVLELRPKHAAANLALGQFLLEQGRHEGEDFVRTILDEPGNALTAEACTVLARHYQVAGQKEKLRAVYRQLYDFHQNAGAAVNEQYSVSARDQFVEHGLPDEPIQNILRMLADQPELADAYLVRKQLRYLERQPVYVLCVRSQPGFLGRTNSIRDTVLVNRLIGKVPLPGRALVIAPQQGFKPIARKIMSLPFAQIYARTTSVRTIDLGLVRATEQVP